jgi:competence protein ComEA
VERVQKFLPWIIGGVGALLIVGGVVWEKIKPDTKSDVVIYSKNDVASVAGVKTNKKIKVDIEGAVEKPGVYEIPFDSRIEDVLISAGGLSVKADREYVSKSVNLAQKLIDGAKIYIPELNGSNNSNISNLPNTPNSQLTNINIASESELDKLPGIGPVTAAKIIAGRPYQTLEELVSKKAVSQSVFTKIKDKISLY